MIAVGVSVREAHSSDRPKSRFIIDDDLEVQHDLHGRCPTCALTFRSEIGLPGTTAGIESRSFGVPPPITALTVVTSLHPLMSLMPPPCLGASHRGDVPTRAKGPDHLPPAHRHPGPGSVIEKSGPAGGGGGDVRPRGLGRGTALHHRFQGAHIRLRQIISELPASPPWPIAL